jgi:branched-chain amino acid transport system substrate-binding protein
MNGVAAGVAAFALLYSATVQAQAPEQFFPMLTFRTGPYAPSGTPWANGFVDYYKLTNMDGGINGVKVVWEECETGYATDKGVECYERLKNANGGATVFQTMSTGITFALTPRGPVDKMPLLTPGYGLSESADGSVFKWSFPIGGTHWASADTQFQYMAEKAGGIEKLKGKKVVLLYHDSPYGKEALPIMRARAQQADFNLTAIPVAHPGLDQKSAWLQIRRLNADYVLLWGWGVMNSTALKEAQGTGIARSKVIGVWPSGSDSDVQGVSGASGYTAVLLLPGPGMESKIVQKVISKIYDGNRNSAVQNGVGSALYMRGLMNAMVSVEGVRTAQERYGVGKRVTSEQARWGYENLNIDESRLKALDIDDIMRPIKTTCADHMGPAAARAYLWDGKAWKVNSDWLTADPAIIQPLIEDAVKRGVAEQKFTVRTPEDCAH